MIDRDEHEGDVDGAAALVGAERDRLEQVRRAGLGQREGGLAGGGHVLVPHPQDQAAGVLLVVGLGPHAAELAAQPGGELVAPVHHLGHGDAVGQVEVGAPAGAVPGDRVLEVDRLFRVLAHGLVDRADAEGGQGADHHVTGQLLRLAPGHGPVNQRPVGRGAELAEDDHRGGQHGQLDRPGGGQDQDQGDHRGDRGQDEDRDAEADAGIALAGQLQVGLGVGPQHGGRPDRVTLQVERPPGQPGHRAGEAARGAGGQLGRVLRDAGQVVERHVPVVLGQPLRGGQGLAAGPQRGVDDRPPVPGPGGQVGQPVRPVVAGLVHPDHVAFQHRAVRHDVRRGVRAGVRRGGRAVVRGAAGPRDGEGDDAGVLGVLGPGGVQFGHDGCSFRVSGC